MSLDSEGQMVLKLALEGSEGKLERLASAVRVALKGISGERWGYLYREVTRIAKRRIRDKERKKKETPPPKFMITPAVRFDAMRHEKELCRSIPQEDR